MKPSAAQTLTALREAGPAGLSTGELCNRGVTRAPKWIGELRHLHGYTIDQEPLDRKSPRGPQRYALRPTPHRNEATR